LCRLHATEADGKTKGPEPFGVRAFAVKQMRGLLSSLGPVGDPHCQTHTPAERRAPQRSIQWWRWSGVGSMLDARRRLCPLTAM
jgi:hypothetical protein